MQNMHGDLAGLFTWEHQLLLSRVDTTQLYRQLHTRRTLVEQRSLLSAWRVRGLTGATTTHSLHREVASDFARLFLSGRPRHARPASHAIATQL